MDGPEVVESGEKAREVRLAEDAWLKTCFETGPEHAPMLLGDRTAPGGLVYVTCVGDGAAPAPVPEVAAPAQPPPAPTEEPVQAALKFYFTQSTDASLPFVSVYETIKPLYMCLEGHIFKRPYYHVWPGREEPAPDDSFYFTEVISVTELVPRFYRGPLFVDAMRRVADYQRVALHLGPEPLGTVHRRQFRNVIVHGRAGVPAWSGTPPWTFFRTDPVLNEAFPDHLGDTYDDDAIWKFVEAFLEPLTLVS